MAISLKKIKVSSSVSNEKDFSIELEELRTLAFYSTHSDDLLQKMKSHTANAETDLVDS